MPELLDPILPPQQQPGMPLPQENVLLSSPQVVENPPASEEMVDMLNGFLEMNNIADTLEDNVLTDIGSRVIDDYEIDKDSREDWERVQERSLELAMQITNTRRDMADVNYPTIAISAIQFAARALGNIIKGRDVVRAKVIGKVEPQQAPPPMDMPMGGPPPDGAEYAPTDMPPQMPVGGDMPPGEMGGMPPMPSGSTKDARADRLSAFMSYQMLEEIDDWETNLDALLMMLPVTGCLFKKTYYDMTTRQVKSPLITANDLVVHYATKDIESAPRITHVFELTPNEMVERVRSGVFLDKEFGEPTQDEDRDGSDDDAPHKFLEQHRWWDLDDDGYKEPYVITVHQDTSQVVRITARYDSDGITTNEKGEIVKIEPVQYFTRFIFMPAFDNNFYGMGYGSLLGDLNSTINTTINQLLDAGTLSNQQSGFLGKGINLGRGDESSFRPGEWKHVVNTGDDLRKGIVPLPVREPSGVLFNLLGLMLDASKELSSVSDVLTGEGQGANESPTTILALIEQSLKVFSSIYKRIHRSLRSEYRKVRRLDRLYLPLEVYQSVLDDPEARMSDFYEKDMDVEPVSDETELTSTQKMVKAQALVEMMGSGLNDLEIQKRYLQALDIPSVDKILPAENVEPPPDPEIVLKEQEIEVKRMEAMNDQQRVQIEQELAKAKIEKMEADTARSYASVESTKSQAVNTMAQAENTRAQSLKDEHMAKLDSLTKVVQMQSEAITKLTDRVLEDKGGE
jgi:chaperonin GroES